jgi:hypothetical protein
LERAPELRRQARPLPDWKWFTFPVFVAFAAGIVFMGLVRNGQFLGPVVYTAGLVGLAFGLAHLLTRLWLARRR